MRDRDLVGQWVLDGGSEHAQFSLLGDGGVRAQDWPSAVLCDPAAPGEIIPATEGEWHSAETGDGTGVYLILGAACGAGRQGFVYERDGIVEIKFFPLTADLDDYPSAEWVFHRIVGVHE